MKQNCDGQRFAIFALENQEEIDYGMPVRVMMQEALEYDKQIKAIKCENERAYKQYCKEKNSGLQTVFYKDSGEYLYKIRGKDYICPVMTLVLYWGEDEWKGAKSLHEMINFDSIEASVGKELKKMVPEYPLHFLNLSDFGHFEYFRTELRPLFEMFHRRNNKEDFMNYIKTSKKCCNMDDESWYILGQLTDSKDIQSLIRQKVQLIQQEGRNKSMCKAIEDLKNEGRSEGKAEGKAEDIIILLKEYGVLSKKLKSKILKQTNLSVLDEWFMLAIHTKSVEEFIRQSHIEV